MKKNKTPHIKSFIYLDEEKMYSISSQLFEGMTQYILKEESESLNEEQQQKGNFLSGRFMADMMSQSKGKSEMCYLHDFAFNLFEKELEERSLLYDIKPTDDLTDLLDKGFVRIHGKVVFCDYARMQYIIDNFNNIGRAIGSLQYVANEQLTQFKQDIATTKEREQRNKKQQIVKSVEKKIEEQLKQQGLVLDDKYIKNLSTVMKFGFQESFEVRVVLSESSLNFSVVANPQCFKERGNVLVSKYSRITEKEFTVIGIITQAGNPKPEIPVLQGVDMKTAAQGMNETIANLEMQFNGRSENECIIDPIAIFTELS